MINLIQKALAQDKSIAETVAEGFKFDLANIFGWAIGIGALLALGAIIWGGIEWSTSELAHKKDDGKERIKSAIFGLLLLMGAYLILNTINPNILKF